MFCLLFPYKCFIFQAVSKMFFRLLNLFWLFGYLNSVSVCVCCIGSSVSSLKKQRFSNVHVLKNLTIPFVAVRVCMVHGVQTKELISFMEGSLGSNSDGLFNKVLFVTVGDVSSFGQ